MSRYKGRIFSTQYVRTVFPVIFLCALPVAAQADHQFLDSAVVVDASPASSYEWNGSPYSAPQPVRGGKCHHQVKYAERLFDVDLPLCLKVGATVRVAVQVSLVYPDDRLDAR